MAPRFLTRISEHPCFLAHHPPQFPHWSFLEVLKVESDLQQATPERNGDRVGPVIGAELVHEILDVEVNGGLRYCELIGDLLVAIAISDEPKYFQFPGRQIF